MLKKNGRFLCLTMFCIVYIVAFCEIGFDAYPTADDYSFSASISQLGFNVFSGGGIVRPLLCGNGGRGQSPGKSATMVYKGC